MREFGLFTGGSGTFIVSRLRCVESNGVIEGIQPLEQQRAHHRKPVTMRRLGLFTGIRNIYRKPLTMPRIGCLGEGIEDQRSASAAGEDHFVRALLVGNVATVAALCGRNEEALATLNRLALEPVSFVHLGKLRHGPEWDGLRANARFQKFITDAEPALKAQGK